jgi:hypothetical protein
VKREIKNMPKSVHDRLLALARKSRRPYNELQQRFAMERFLYRLSVSPFADRFTLKGALAFLAWTGDVALYRPTADIDLLGQTSNAEEDLLQLFRQVALTEAPDDGLQFDPESVTIEPIAEDAEYQGTRIKLLGRLGSARVSLQVDIGFGDAPLPRPTTVSLPTLLDFPAPTIRGYRPEASIAEKLHTMVDLEARNSRMKDFADIWFLARHFDFDGKALASAVAATFQRRRTEIQQAPLALTDEFAESEVKQAQWKAFLRRNSTTQVPSEFQIVVSGIRAFLTPVLESVVTGEAFPQRWTASGPWRPKATEQHEG